MSHIGGAETFPYPWYLRILFFLQRRRYGKELEPVQLWGRLPLAYLGMAAMNRALNANSAHVDPALRSLIQVLISRLNSCEFCIDLNSFAGLGRGLRTEQLEALPAFDASPLFGEQEKAALHFAAAVTRGERKVDEAIIVELRRHFSDQAIVELAALIAFQNMSAKFNAALGVEAHGFCALRPHEDPNSSGR